MKKVNLLLAAGLLALATLPAYSSTPVAPGENIIVKTEAVGAKSVKILLANLEREFASVSIENLSGKALFTEKIFKHRGYLLTVNLENLPEGRYLLKIRHEDKIISQVIVVRENEIQLSKLNT